MRLFPLILTMFCCVSGGPLGLEEVVSISGPTVALLMILITPLIWALPVALKTAELTSAIPEEGGYYVWVKRALGPFAGFLCAWWTWLYSIVDIALYPVLFAGYLGSLLTLMTGTNPVEGNPWLSWAIACSILVVFTIVNVRGVREVGNTSIILTIVLMLPFVPMIFLGLKQMAVAGLPHFTDPGQVRPAALGAGLYTVMWNYLGWDSLSTIGGEVDRPERTFPRAIFWCMPAVMLVYFLTVFAGLAGTPNPEQWGESSWPLIAQNLGGPQLGLAMNVAALFSAGALFVATLLANSRLPFVLANDGLFPAALTKIHPKFGTPSRAIILCAVICAFLCFKTFQDLLKVNVVLYGVALIPEGIALLLLRKREPNLPRPYKIPGGWPVLWFIAVAPILILVFALLNDLQDAGLEVLNGQPGNAWLEGAKVQWLTWVALLSGPIAYPLLVRWRSRSTPEA
ncbi:MAG: APC family permease [Fimbriimonas sp.]